MAKAKASPATRNTPNNPEAPSVTVIKKAQTKSLEGKATLGYCLGTDAAGALHWRLASNSGGGFFSVEWIPFSAIQAALEEWPEDRPITSMALRPLFAGKSANNPSFLMATLVAEGLLEPMPDRRRHYQRCDPKAFLAEVKKLQGGHSKPGKPRAKANRKAGTRMAKPTNTPAKAK